MKIKKLFIRMLIGITLGLCAGIIMELTTSGLIFPAFLIVGILAGIFIGVVIELVPRARMITWENLRKLKKPALRILIAISTGLLAGMVLEYTALWHVFPFFLISGIVLGSSVGITFELVRYCRLMKKAFLESSELGLMRLPLSTAELIRQIIKKMHYRKEVRNEVMSELVSHFEDELKDCKTDEEKEKKAGQLIDNFGDTKLLAILLRRAKIRCRPLWRTVVARTFQAAGILMLCFIFYAVWFSKGQPTISVDYLALFNKMNKPDVRDDDNAWPHYEKAIALYIEPGERIRGLTERRRKDFKRRLSFSDLKEEMQNKIRWWLGENKSNWDNLEPSQKQLIERCFREGLVPLADYSVIGGYSHSFSIRNYSFKQYRVFDEAIKVIIERIKDGEPDYQPYYGREIEMEMMFHRGNQREIELDSNIALDSELISSFGSYSQEELKKIKQGIDAGVISRWINSPPIASMSLFDHLLPFERKLIVKWLEDNESAWEEFRAGSSKSYCYKEYQYNDEGQVEFLWTISYRHLQQMRDLVRVGIWRSRVAQQQGRLQQSMDDCLAIARAGNHWQDKETIIEQLMGLAFRNLAYNELLPVVAAQRLSAVELKELHHQLSQFYSQGYPLMDLEGEKMAFMDAVQRLFTDGGPGGGHLIPQKASITFDMYDEIVEIAEDVPVGGKFVENVTLTSMCLLHARRDATVEFGGQMYDKQAEVAGTSPYQRHERNLMNTEEILKSMSRYRYTLLYYCTPAAERLSELSYQGKVLHEVIITMLAIQQWRQEKDNYPENLDDLVEGGFLKELPMDPYSDKPLIYKKTEENFVLYSVGRNFEDDGGRIFINEHEDVEEWGTYEKGDAVFWPVMEL